MRAILPLVLLLTGCQAGVPFTPVSRGDQVLRVEINQTEPVASDTTCWARETIPAVMGKEVGDVLVAPEELDPDGTVVQPAIYRRAELDVVVEPERPFWFRTPCPPTLTAAFIASVQRALAARDGYSGPITGKLDAATQEAIRAYQAPQGLDSAVLSMKAAQQLGLINYDLDAFER